MIVKRRVSSDKNQKLDRDISCVKSLTSGSHLAFVGELTKVSASSEVGEFERRRVDRIPT